RYIHKGAKPPEKCPICNVPASKFKEIQEQTAASEAKQDIQESGLERMYSILIKHHAHPVSVHTPNGILPVAVVLWIGAWIFNYDILSKAAIINMIFVIIALPMVIFTGVLEWKKKYKGALNQIFKLKILSATLTSGLCVISVGWYLVNPEVLSSDFAWLFIVVNIIMVIFAGISGHIGGKLVFKD
ncbi:MAG: rubredoxin, partial [Desulfobacteraceae bacterium]|nr:rubredoxin [Desulfobacteraceae bacterium]